MTDEYNQCLQKEQDDAALKLLMEEYAEIEGEALWREFQAAEAAGNGPDAQARENRESCRGSKEKNRQTNFLLRLGKGLSRAAVIFLALICLLSPMVLSVESFKIPVINYFVTLKDVFSAFDFGENTGMTQEQESVVDLVLSAPFPDNCQFSGQMMDHTGKIGLDFKREDILVMRITMYPSNGQITIDTEDVEQVPMKIYNYSAAYLQKDGHRLMWMDADRQLVFDVHAYNMEETIFWRYVYTLIDIMSK